MKLSKIQYTNTFQVLGLLALSLIAYQQHITKLVVLETRNSLESTILIMNDVEKQSKETKATKLIQKQEVVLIPLTIGNKAPDFSLQDENKQTVNLKDYTGKKVMLVISDSQCENCDNYYLVVNEFVKQNKAFKVLILEMNSTPEQNKALKTQKNINATLLATPTEIIVNYGISATPTTIIINENGVVTGNKVCKTLAELTSLVQ